MKTALVCGAGGFIGGHLVKRLTAQGFWVRGTDLKYHEFSETQADDFVIGDLRDPYFCRDVIDRRFDEIYQLAADMGGAGFIFTGENDADIMHNSAIINLNILDACFRRRITRIFYSSSACMYPAYNQVDRERPNWAENSAYQAAPDKRIRLGEAVQRAALSELCPLPRDGGAYWALSQHLRTGGHVAQRPREGTSGLVPQGRHGAAPSRFGVMASKRGPSCTSRNASKGRCGSCARDFRGRLRRRMSVPPVLVVRLTRYTRNRSIQ